MDRLSLQAVTDTEILKVKPPSLIIKIRVYNAIMANPIDNLFGTSLEKKYPLSTQENQSVPRFWEGLSSIERIVSQVKNTNWCSIGEMIWS